VIQIAQTVEQDSCQLFGEHSRASLSSHA